IFLSFIIPVYVVLSMQANWLQSDKTRISMTLLFPLVVMLACGLAFVVRSLLAKKLAAPLALVALTPLLIFLPRAAARLDFETTDFYQHWNMLYAQESEQYHQVVARATTSVGLLPDYGRIDREIDSGLKRGLLKLNEHMLFFTAPEISEHLFLYRDWGLLFPDDYSVKPRSCDGEPMLLSIDLNTIGDPSGPAVQLVDSADGERMAVDLSVQRIKMLPHFDRVLLAWQDQPVSINVDLERAPFSWSDRTSTVIDLNLYSTSAGQLSLPHHPETMDNVDPDDPQGAPGPGLPSISPRRYIPADFSDGRLLLRVRAGCPLIVRNWIINHADSTVLRVDVFELCWDGDVPTGMRFRFNEPRFYF
ncbi:MAG: hypothetical protein P9M14_13260, partial [Candidatus Alcyoniella australis]|nr:hypothetical protein [Candidatus Alcyoniella australis]